MTSALSAYDLAIGYGKHIIAERIALNLMRGEVAALIGRNGIGKSTLIKTLTGSLKPISGIITLEDKPLEVYRKSQLSRIISIVSTSEALTGGLRLSEYVGLGRSPYTGILGILNREDKKRVVEAMELVGIGHKSDDFFSQLSDGERQKGMIGRALAQNTPIIIMDEPFSFLDVASRIELLLILKDIARKQNKAILFSTHEVTQALRMADRIWLFHPDSQGNHATITAGTAQEIVAKGKIKLLFDNPHIEFDPITMDFIHKPL